MRVACVLFLLMTLGAPFALAEINPGTMNRMKSCDPAISLAAAKEVLDDPSSLQEVTPLFNAAYFMYGHGKKDEAVFWFYAAQLRFRYFAAVKPGDAGQLLSIFIAATGLGINNYAFHDVAKLERIIDDVLAWDKVTPNPMKELVGSPSEAEVRKVYEGLDELKAKLRKDKDELEKAAKAASHEVQWRERQSREMDCVASAAPETLDGAWGTEKFRLYLVQKGNRLCGEHSEGGPRSVVGVAARSSAAMHVTRPDGYRMRVLIRRVNDTLESEFPEVLKKGEGGDLPLVANIVLTRRTDDGALKRVAEECNQLFDSVKR